MFCANQIRRLVQRACIFVLVGALGVVLLGLGARVEIVMKAAGIPKNAVGIGGFVNGAHALVQPALVMVAAVAPLALVAGGVILMFGRALEDPDPLRGIAQLTARLGAAFMLDLDGVTRTKTLGSERMARKLRDALPGGEGALRASVWELMRPMLSPALVALNRDVFVPEADPATTVDLALHRSATSLDDLDLGDHQTETA